MQSMLHFILLHSAIIEMYHIQQPLMYTSNVYCLYHVPIRLGTAQSKLTRRFPLLTSYTFSSWQLVAQILIIITNNKSDPENYRFDY